MPRILVPLPAAVCFTARMKVQVGDLNYGNHLSNDAVLRLCHETRLRWLLSLGWNELDAAGAGLIMADAAVQYLAQAYYGEPLRVEMGSSEVGKGGFVLLYHLVRESDEKSIARVSTGMVCFDYGKQKVCRLPEVLKQVLEAV